nr:hypothetical protein [Tanacetum cinerariifolium]
MSTSVFVDPESYTQADGAQSSRVPVPLPEDPYEAIRQAYLVGTDMISNLLRATGTFDARSTSSDSTAPLSPDHPLTHTTPVLVPILRRTARMAVRVPPVMLSGLSTGMAEVAAMSDSAFRKRKRYRGTSELILGTDSEEDEEVEESSNSDSESEDVKEEGPTTEDEDHAVEDVGLVARVEGPSIDVESYGLDGESHGLDDESHGLDDESYGIDGEGRGLESDGLGLGWRRLYLRVSSRSLEHEHERIVVTFEALWRPVLALEAWAGHRFTVRVAGDEGSCDCVGARKGP